MEHVGLSQDIPVIKGTRFPGVGLNMLAKLPLPLIHMSSILFGATMVPNIE